MTEEETRAAEQTATEKTAERRTHLRMRLKALEGAGGMPENASPAERMQARLRGARELMRVRQET